ncbi:DMT family transporter [Indiicoccus explosivorum]|uniref:DMT family transporter n=1 Tax=Indiicoccus explosivorum TaxID=1917864 RepID=UPI000B445CEF|nr:EamA family transporter [Indiicoccus explosivorum]
MAYLFVLLGAILWGTTGTAQSFIEGEAHPLTIGAFRLAIGGFSLLIFAAAAGKLKLNRTAGASVFLSAVSMALFQPLFFSSVQLTGIAVGTVVTIGSAPMLSGIIEWLFLKRRPDRVWVLATALAIAGCILLFAEGETLTIDPAGVLAGLGGGLAFATYATVSKQALERMDTVSAVAVIFSLAALLLLPFLWVFDTGYAAEAGNLAVLLYLGIGATTLAYMLFSAGLRHIRSSAAVTLSLAEPLTAALLGVLLVGETLSALAWTGVALLLAGIVALSAKRWIS